MEDIKDNQPDIVRKLTKFFNYWDNPDNEEGETKSIHKFQLAVYGVSYNFTFKWWVKQSEIDEVADYLNIKLRKNQRVLRITFGEYEIELATCKSLNKLT